MRSRRKDFFLRTVEAVLKGVAASEGVECEADWDDLGRLLRAADPELYRDVVVLITRALADKNDTAMTETNIPT